MAKSYREDSTTRNTAKARQHAKRITNRKFRRTPINLDDSGVELDRTVNRITRFDLVYGLKHTVH